jgi:hypothetical protein
MGPQLRKTILATKPRQAMLRFPLRLRVPDLLDDAELHCKNAEDDGDYDEPD